MFGEVLGAVAPDPGWTTWLPRGTSGQSWMYPIMITLGFIIAIVLTCVKLWKKYKVSVDPFYWFVLIGVPVGILGANFGSCVLDSFWQMAGSPGGHSPGKPWSQFFSDFGSGLAIEWGVIFVLIAFFIYFPLVLKKPKYRVRDEFGEKPVVRPVSMWLYLDALAPCVLLAQFLGRWGNYFNGEVYGAAVSNESFTWFLHNCLPGMYIGGEWHTPLFLWEGIGNLAMFFVLYFGIEAIKQRKAGDLAGAYLVWYGVFRACLEPLRDVQFRSTSSIVLSAIFATIGAAFIVCNHLLSKKWRQIKYWQSFKAAILRAFGKQTQKPDVNGEVAKPKFFIHRSEEEMLYYCGY